MNRNPVVLLAMLSMLLAACGESTSTPVAEATPATASAGPERIQLSDAQLRSAGVEIAVVGPAVLRDTLPLYGTVTVNAERARDVVARYPGLVKTVDHRVGDTVRQGETLATVESNESLQTYPVASPLTGTIASRNANAGEQTSDRPLFVVVDLSTVWVELSLYAQDAPKVHKGQAVLIRSPGADARAAGYITYVGPFGARATQSLTARALLSNPALKWTPGLYVSGDVVLAERNAPLAIRRSAVQRIADQPVVFARTRDAFEIRHVELGRGDGEFVEVLAGLEAGESYAAANSYVLKAEALKSQAESD